MSDRTPDFAVIGAMKSATTTLHEQLARQPGLFMSRPKEPNFFSDDDVYARGSDWYHSLFAGADASALCGESSTHYTKRPTYPHTVDRLARACPRIRLVYVMRHPVDRLMSHYVHERTNGRITAGLDEALDRHPELVDYGRYHMQLRPYLDAFGPERLLPVFFGRLVRHPQAELERVCRFVGYEGRPHWDPALGPQNVGRERLRKSALREALVHTPVLKEVRRWVVPRSWSESVKALWRAKMEPPRATPALLARLRAVFDDDLARLGDLLSVPLSCETFHEATGDAPREWAGADRRG